MKHLSSIILGLVTLVLPIQAQTAEGASFEKWFSNKYSMFIHFGLYSHLGGVWNGEPVRWGYSEQIQSFAGIFSDWYARTAYEFAPVNFDAQQIAKLAKKAGMRSIVFTSKHHDGFCMYDTQTTCYNSMDMLAQGRDFVKELSEACAKEGLNFGLYFSLIDWNYPHAYPISSHNADFVTKEHHEFSKAQVRELLTSYGRISELWFDMGSLEPWQSKELYELVKSLQPDCMVSGRLGNDYYDFAVMADNKLPQTALQAPWQSAASMFNETWSYRSWQERGLVSDKVAEKLRTLIKVVSHGGNYLLNIGPASDGSVVEFEKDVLLAVGKWLENNAEAVYGTKASPFTDEFAWGDVTAKGNELYLLLTGACPDNGLICLPAGGMRLRSADGAKARISKGFCQVHVDEAMYADPTDVHVVKLAFDRPVQIPADLISAEETLSWANAVPEFSYSCFDYYSNYRSTVGYTWNVRTGAAVSEIEIQYTSGEEGREIVLDVDGAQIPVVLTASGIRPSTAEVSFAESGYTRLRGGVFDGPASWEGVECSTVAGAETFVEMPVLPFCNHLMAVKVVTDKAGSYVFDVTAGNGVEVVVNGAVQTKHLNPYRTVKKTEKLLVDLPEGASTILVRAYNRFENTLSFGIGKAQEQKIRHMTVKLPSTLRKGTHTIKLHAADRPSGHADCGLHNLKVNL